MSDNSSNKKQIANSDYRTWGNRYDPNIRFNNPDSWEAKNIYQQLPFEDEHGNRSSFPSVKDLKQDPLGALGKSLWSDNVSAIKTLHPSAWDDTGIKSVVYQSKMNDEVLKGLNQAQQSGQALSLPSDPSFKTNAKTFGGNPDLESAARQRFYNQHLATNNALPQGEFPSVSLDAHRKALQAAEGSVDDLYRAASPVATEAAEQFAKSGMGKVANTALHLPGKLAGAANVVLTPLELGARLSSGQDIVEAGSRTAGNLVGGGLGFAGGTAVGTALGGTVGAALAPFTFGLSVPALAIGGGILGSVAGSMLAQKALDIPLGTEEENALKRQRKQIDDANRANQGITSQAMREGEQMQQVEQLGQQTQDLEGYRRQQLQQLRQATEGYGNNWDIRPVERYSFVNH